MAGYVAGFTAVREAGQLAGLPATWSSLLAGAMTVGIPYATQAQYTEFYQGLVRQNLKLSVPKSAAVVGAGISGAACFGGADIALRALGIQW